MLTNRQKELINLILTHYNTLAYGGARSGKTYAIIDCIITLALIYPNTRYLCARRFEVDIKSSIWGDTLPKVLRDKDLVSGVDFKSTERPMEILFSNGSKIICAGLDDKERVDKILGTEYSLIYLNESQDIPWPTVKLLSTRLAQKEADKRRLICDLNPGSINHWTYKLFFLNIDPETKQGLIADHYAKIQLNPMHNKDNLPDDFIELKLKTLTGAAKSRFLLGEYQTDSEIKVFSPKKLTSINDFKSFYNNDFSELQIVGGLDLGYRDADALCFIAFVPGIKDLWVIYEHKARRQSIDFLVEAIKFGLTWIGENIPRPRSGDIDIFADTATLRYGVEGDNKKTAAMLSQQYGLPVRPAYKRDKKIMIEFVQSGINDGWIHVLKNGFFAEEIDQTVWTRLDDGVIEREIDNDQFHPDMLDAVIYAVRYIINVNDALQNYTTNDINTKQVFRHFDEPTPVTVFDQFLQTSRGGW